MDAKEAEIIFAIVGGLILIAIGFISTVSKQKALEDPEDDSVVYLDDVVNNVIYPVTGGNREIARALREQMIKAGFEQPH